MNQWGGNSASVMLKSCSLSAELHHADHRPGPDFAPVHDRQVCVLKPEDWAAWLFLSKPQEELLRPLPEGTLVVKVVRERKV